jgi:hypothetical protein
VWRYVYRSVDDQGQMIDVFVSARRDIAAARRFFTTARVVIAGHAFIQNVRRGHYELGVEATTRHRRPCTTISWPTRTEKSAATL